MPIHGPSKRSLPRLHPLTHAAIGDRFVEVEHGQPDIGWLKKVAAMEAEAVFPSASVTVSVKTASCSALAGTDLLKFVEALFGLLIAGGVPSWLATTHA